MLINEYLSIYDVNSKYSIDVNTSPEKVYGKIYSLDLGESRIIRLLFRLRGMPKESVTLEGLQKMRFVKLGEVKNEELLLGVIGRFWTMTGDLQKVNAEEFKKFEKEGYAKAVWNFTLTEKPNEVTEVTTETRVHCIGEACRNRFLRYWRIIGPFSGWIRKEALRVIKRNSE